MGNLLRHYTEHSKLTDDKKILEEKQELYEKKKKKVFDKNVKKAQRHQTSTLRCALILFNY
jgi:hypothetical protein